MALSNTTRNSVCSKCGGSCYVETKKNYEYYSCGECGYSYRCGKHRDKPIKRVMYDKAGVVYGE